MNKQISTNKPQTAKGFTIIELLIATAVFSTVLLLALTGFLQIGKIFYKGINATQTNAVARQMLDNLKNDVAYSSDTSSIAQDPQGVPSNGSHYFCAGSNRYVFMPFKKLDVAVETYQRANLQPINWTMFGLLKDTVSTAGSCPNPFSATLSDQLKATTAQELLSDKMRVSMLKVTQYGVAPYTPSPGLSDLYSLNIKLAYGDNEVLTNFDQPSATCNGSVHSSFCFTTQLQTTVRKGF